MNKESKIRLSSRIAVISGAGLLFIALILLLNFFQIKYNAPLEAESREVLTEILKENPNNAALREEIRSLDLMARKAFFIKEWQIRTGTYILLFFSVLLIVSLRVYFGEKEKISAESLPPPNPLLEKITGKKWMLGTLFVLLAAGLFSSFAVRSDYKILEQKNSAEVKPQQNDSPDKIVSENTLPADTSVLEFEADSLQSDTLETEPESEEEEKYASLYTVRRQHNAFRGAWGQGVVYAENIPTDWDVASGKNILWKKPVPMKGYNSPIVWGGRLFFSGATQTERAVYCYNRNKGILIWKRKADNIPGSPAKPPKTTDDTGLAAPGMTTDGNRVYAVFGTGDIIAFDLDGNRQWAKNLGVPDNHYGHSSSLLCHQGKLFVQYDTNDSGRLLILDAKTGDILHDVRRDEKISWASPILAQAGGKLQLILASNPNVVSYDIASGKELWSTDCLMGEVGPSPAYYNGLVYAVNEYAKLVAINPSNGSIVWETMDYMSEVSSPVGANGLLFVPTSYGVLACYDAKTGALVWEKDFDDGFYASPMAVGNTIYLIDLGGNCHIFEAAREYKEIASHSFGEAVYATPAYAKGRIYVRGEKHLFCIGEKE